MIGVLLGPAVLCPHQGKTKSSNCEFLGRRFAGPFFDVFMGAVATVFAGGGFRAGGATFAGDAGTSTIAGGTTATAFSTAETASLLDSCTEPFGCCAALAARVN